MISKIQHVFALSRQGAKDFVKAVVPVSYTHLMCIRDR